MRDQTGYDTLEIISKAASFNKWMYDTNKPYLKGAVLEIGSGIGNISQFILADGFKVTLSDIDKQYQTILEQKFSGYPNLSAVTAIDLANENYRTDYQHLQNQFDSVILLNVLEHIQSEMLAFSILNYLLHPDGNLIILVPAYPFLFCNLDRELGHFRRYTKKTLTNSFRKNGMKIIMSNYFNVVGIAGWFLFGKIIGRKQIGSQNMKVYNKLVPFNKAIDSLLQRKIGLSVIAIGKKDTHA